MVYTVKESLSQQEVMFAIAGHVRPVALHIHELDGTHNFLM